MRQIVLDTETTGLSAEGGDRIIELGCVELFARKLTGKNLHFYFNPERDSHEDALKVHGISNEFLRDKPKFAAIADELLEYLRDAELIIHNAPFDIGFLNAELDRLGRVPVGTICGKVTDTLRMAKDLHPGKRNSLDALCERYEIDNSSRTLHGALLDTELLAEIFEGMKAYRHADGSVWTFRPDRNAARYAFNASAHNVCWFVFHRIGCSAVRLALYPAPHFAVHLATSSDQCDGSA